MAEAVPVPVPRLRRWHAPEVPCGEDAKVGSQSMDANLLGGWLWQTILDTAHQHLRTQIVWHSITSLPAT